MSSKKFERTTQEQLEYFVQFSRDHPELQAGKNSPYAPRTVQNLWGQLADHLNAMRGPTRTSAKWKESLSHWKYQLRSRARKEKVQMAMTGGGPRVTDVTEFEHRALQTFGGAAVDGLPTVRALGLQELTQQEVQVVADAAERAPSCTAVALASTTEGALSLTGAILSATEGAPSSTAALHSTAEGAPSPTAPLRSTTGGALSPTVALRSTTEGASSPNVALRSTTEETARRSRGAKITRKNSQKKYIWKLPRQ